MNKDKKRQKSDKSQKTTRTDDNDFFRTPVWVVGDASLFDPFPDFFPHFCSLWVISKFSVRAQLNKIRRQPTDWLGRRGVGGQRNWDRDVRSTDRKKSFFDFRFHFSGGGDRSRQISGNSLKGQRVNAWWENNWGLKQARKKSFSAKKRV